MKIHFSLHIFVHLFYRKILLTRGLCIVKFLSHISEVLLVSTYMVIVCRYLATHLTFSPSFQSKRSKRCVRSFGEWFVHPLNPWRPLFQHHRTSKLHVSLIADKLHYSKTRPFLKSLKERASWVRVAFLIDKRKQWWWATRVWNPQYLLKYDIYCRTIWL